MEEDGFNGQENLTTMKTLVIFQDVNHKGKEFGQWRGVSSSN